MPNHENRKRFVRLAVTGCFVLSGLMYASSGAADTIPGETETTLLTGGFLGGWVERDGAAGLQAGYWSEYVGFALAAGFHKQQLSATVTNVTLDFVDETAFGLGARGMIGLQVGPAKPYLSLGLGIGTASDILIPYEEFAVLLSLGIGLALQPTESLFMTISFLDFDTFLTGDVKIAGVSATPSGFRVGLFPGFSVNYLF